MDFHRFRLQLAGFQLEEKPGGKFELAGIGRGWLTKDHIPGNTNLIGRR